MELMRIFNESENRTPDQYGYDIGMWEYSPILDTISSFSNAPFEFTRVKDFGEQAKPTDSNVVSWFDSYVKSKLDENEPVILHIAEYRANQDYTGYHSVVAYYYDSQGIHANFGWGPSSTDTVISSEYQITEAGAINFDQVALNHSDNFIVNNVKYCGCGVHVHSYHMCTPFSSSQHKVRCDCGEWRLRPHVIDPQTTTLFHGHNYGTCAQCGAFVDLGTTPANTPNPIPKHKTSESGETNVSLDDILVSDSDGLAGSIFHQ